MDNQPSAPKVAIPRLKGRDYDRTPNQPKKRNQANKACSVACNTCRKRKARCTGEQPRCQSCADQDLPCVYLLTRQNRLKEATDRNDEIIAFLKNLSGNSVGAQKQRIDELLNSVENNSSTTESVDVQGSHSNWAEEDVTNHPTPATGVVSGGLSERGVFPSLPSISTLTAGLSPSVPTNRSLVEEGQIGCENRDPRCTPSHPICSTCMNSRRPLVDRDALSRFNSTTRKRNYEELQVESTGLERPYAYTRTQPVKQSNEALYMIESGSASHPSQSGHTIENSVYSDVPTREEFYTTSFLANRPSNSQRHPRHRLTAKYHHPDYVFEELWQEPRDMYGENSTIVYLASSALPVSRWTTVSSDEKLLNHLLLLFWTWDMIVNRVVDRTLFEEDLRTLDPSKQESTHFCSPFLVNALLALACLYTTHSATFCTTNDPLTRGAAFAREAERLLALEESRASLPVAQGLAALYVYEGNLGKLSKLLLYGDCFYRAYEKIEWDQWTYLNAEMTDAMRHVRVQQGLSWIHWGFYIYEWKSVHSYGRRKNIKKPERPKLWQNKQESLLSREDTADYWWFAYPLSLTAQVSMKREIYDAECDLVEIVDELMNYLDPQEGHTALRETPAKAHEFYRRVTELNFSLPERLRLEDAMHPAAITLHVNFHIVLLSILSPFDDMTEEQFGSFNPRATSYHHASSIMSTVWTFRSLYTVQHEFWLIQVCSVCAFRVVFDLSFSIMQLETFTRACQALHEMSERFPLARDILASIQSATHLRRVELPSYARNHLTDGITTRDDHIMGYTVVPVTLRVDKGKEEGSAGEHERLTLSALLMKLDLDTGPD